MSDRWWQRGVIYQVYPRSFADSVGDGVGDLRGIIARLAHLEWLGIDALWISPVFPSPMADFGYDVSDYTDIDPLFGTLADMDDLIEQAHRRGLRVVLDFVPNHSSDRHPWFADARSGRSTPHRDWYIWRDPAPGGSPPNDWLSAFGGSAWEFDDATGQYYFHTFLKEQPDLDWRNAEVRAAMANVLRFWLRRGVDGFRVDVIWLLAKGPELEVGRALGEARAELGLGGDQPAVHQVIAELRSVVDEFDDRLLVGEIYLPLERLVSYYGEAGRGLHLPTNFQLLLMDWQAPAVDAMIRRYEALLPADAWPNWVLSNHDNSRVAARLGAAQARVAVMLLLTLRGTPTLYYGDEIGMADVEVPAAAQRDPQGLREAGMSRDMARTPMRWEPGPTAGFTAGQPWLPIGPAVGEINVATQREDPDSMLSLYRRLLSLRRREPALNRGSWMAAGATQSSLAYVRRDGQRRYLVALNLTSAPTEMPAEARAIGAGLIEVATSVERQGERLDACAGLRPDEGLVVLLD
jgi:alpha-glucosidase